MQYNIIIPLTRPELLERCAKWFNKENTIIIEDLKHNEGVAKARNIGAEKADKEWLLFMDDDVYFKEKPDFKIDSGYDIIYPKVMYENGAVMHPRDKGEELFPRMGTVFLIKKKKIDEIKFDERYFFYFEDEDFFERCRRANFKAKYVPEIIAYHPVNPRRMNPKYFYRVIKNSMYYYLKFRKIPGRRLSDVLINDAGKVIIKQGKIFYIFIYPFAIIKALYDYLSLGK